MAIAMQISSSAVVTFKMCAHPDGVVLLVGSINSVVRSSVVEHPLISFVHSFISPDRSLHCS